jgi:branched-chain amino acid transport system permease protein/neutral amino acid transport system permease protein
VDVFLQSVGFGLVTASVLAIGAVGATLQVGITNFINFAYGDFMTFGAYMAFLVVATLHQNLFLGLIAAAIATAILAVALDKIVFTPFMRKKPKVVTMTVVTLGLSLMISGILQAVFGSLFKTYGLPTPRSYNVGPFIFTTEQLIIIGCAVVVLGGLEMLLRFTKVGKALRAMSDNMELAQASAINVRTLTRLTWAIAGALSGISGVVLILQVGVLTPTTGLTYLFIVMAPVIMGGIGKPMGTILAAVLMGMVLEVSGAYLNSGYSIALAFGVLVVALMVRPQGLFAARARH